MPDNNKHGDLFALLDADPTVQQFVEKGLVKAHPEAR